jgi:hypothetical protein
VVVHAGIWHAMARPVYMRQQAELGCDSSLTAVCVLRRQRGGVCRAAEWAPGRVLL